MNKKLTAYLEIQNFEKIDNVDGYRYIDEEATIEIISVGKKYIVRLETSQRFEMSKIEYFEYNGWTDIIDFVEGVFNYEVY